MKNTGKFGRIFFAFILSLSLGFVPSLTVYAQQGAQKQSASQAESSAKKTQQVTKEVKQSSDDELVPLSDAEMEKVEGGVPWVTLIRLAPWAYRLYTYLHSKQQSCK